MADPLVRLLEPGEVFLARATLTAGRFAIELPDYVARAGWQWPPSTEDATTFFSSIELRARWAKPENIRIRFQIRLSFRTMSVWMLRTDPDTWTVIWAPAWDDVTDFDDPQIPVRSASRQLASVVVSANGTIEWSNERFRDMAELSGSGRGIVLADVLPSDMAAALDKVVADVAAGAVVDRLLPSIQPGPRWLRVHANPAPRPDVDDLLIAIQFEEMTSDRGEPAVIEQLVRDPLTDLYTRRALFDIAALDDPRSSPFTFVLLLDIRRFRTINEVWGPVAADECLTAVARWLRNRVGERDIVVRLVADQFLVLATADNDLVEQIERAGELTVPSGGHQIPVVLRAGWVHREPGQRLTLAAERAERALEQAKLPTSARVVRWTEQLAKHVNARLAEEESVRRAISAGDVRVFFQPLVNAATGELVGMEALVRLAGVGAAISAERVIAAAQQLGLSDRLNEQIHAKAFAQAQRLRSWFPDMHVAVNLARDAVGGGEAIDGVLAAAELAGLPTSAIWVELTEEFAVGVSTANLLSELRRAAGRGLAIVIDDFGRGETALSMLRGLPLTAIKLDRSLLPVGRDERGWRFVEGTVSLLNTLAPRLVAEGVETREQSRRLLDLGVTVQQGFLFGAAQPIEFWLEHPEQLGRG